MTMIVERSMSDGFLTNTYLVAAGPNSEGCADASGQRFAAACFQDRA